MAAWYDAIFSQPGAGGSQGGFLTPQAMLMGGLGAGLGQLGGGWKNPYQGIGQQMEHYYQPYMQGGLESFQHPGEALNQIGGGFHESPGFNFALQKALQGASHAAAAGGYAGGPMDAQNQMELATQLGNQDYYNWLNHAQQQQSGIGQFGYGASNELASNQALLAALQAQQQNQRKSGVGSLLGSLGSIGGLALGTGLGGPVGGAVGSVLGSGLGSALSRVFN